MSKKSAPYGTWDSPITADALVSDTVIDDVLVDPVTSIVYHIERRSTGSNALVNTGTGADVIAGHWNVRTRVQEYGGGAAIAYDGHIYFSNAKDGRLYRVQEGATPEPITPENPALRFANFAVHPKLPTLLVSVLEDHTDDTPQTVINTICVINTTTKSVSNLQGIPKADFFAAPTLSPDGTKLAWQQWYQPDMPWEGADIYVADVVSDISDENIGFHVTNAKHVAGKKLGISAAYPSWANDSTLIFTTDESGYQNPWTYSTSTQQARSVFPNGYSEDFSGPAWTLGSSPYAMVDNLGNLVLFAAFRRGRNVLYLVDLQSGTVHGIEPCPFATISKLRQVNPDRPEIVFLASKSDGPGGVVRCILSNTTASASPTYKVLKSTELSGSPSTNFPPGIISLPQPLMLQIPHENSLLPVVFYAPTNPAYEGSSISGEKPPCVIDVHGGPTAMESQALSWNKQYFTSRGWAWLDVNYGGSSGYGRQYIGLLSGMWGIRDVQDCLHAAKSLSEDIDSTRTVIRGASSGGYTVLSALSFGVGNSFYAAATSLYGVSNLRLLTQFTHKYELRFMEKLMGGTIEEIPHVYDEERSPLFHADKINKPILFLQGSDDQIVPPEQSEVIVKSIQDRGGKVKYVLFQDEGHGFRKAENIKMAVETEIGWYEDILGLKGK